MTLRSKLFAAVTLAGLAGAAAVASVGGAALAGDLQPNQSRLLELGGLNGVAYYTVEPKGYRVVATLAEGESGKPVRFEALLASGSSVILSAPREAGVEPMKVEISRQGDTILVQDGLLTN